MRIGNALAALVLGAVMLTGCATIQPTFHVKVDSSSDTENHKNKYILLPGNKDTKASDLQFKEYAVYVNRALMKQGFIPAESEQEARMAIFLMYGIGDPSEHQYTYSMPTWGQTGVILPAH